MPRSQDSATGALAENRRHYELLVSMVRHYADRGDVEHALRAGMLAGNFAWWTPVGLLSDLRLERLLVEAVRGSATPTVDGGRRGGRVLHVLSQAYSLGGHTRLARRWMERDERTSDLVLTNQRSPVPEAIVAAVEASGGEFTDLAAQTHGLLDRARALRRHMDRADLVVMHVHPYDVVALVAANLPGPRPPVVYENHADLNFWLGVGAADVLCDLRPAVRGIDVDLRAVPAERIAVLPMPVDEMRSADSTDLRRGLGIGQDAVVALTVSDNWKVRAPSGRGLHDVVDKVLHFSPRLVMVLVGVTPDSSWDRLSRKYPGRVFCIGRVTDPAPYFGLADVYLESYPTFAGTSPLEAAMVGLPVVGLADAPDTDPAHLFQRWSPGLADQPACTTAGQLAVAVRRLVTDPELRERRGAEARDSVRALHDNPGWRDQLEALYDRARAATAVDVGSLGESADDARHAAVLLRTLGAGNEGLDPRAWAGPLGELYDHTLSGDLSAALSRGRASSIQVRVAEHWDQHPAWTSRLLALAGDRPRLRVSMPFLPGDDVEGSRTVARLTGLLAGIGRTTDDCGDIALETQAPRTPIGLTEELAFSDDILDRLTALVSSPFWEDTGSAAPRELAAAAG